MIFILVCIIILMIIYHYYFKCNDRIDCLFWINLDRSKQRFINMRKLLSEFENIPQKRISAVDGKNKEHINSFLSHMKNKNKTHSNYEYACLLSHLNTIYQFWNSSKKIALILEDDMTLEFKPYWRTSLSDYISNAPSNWEILQLCYISDTIPPNKYSNWKPTYFSTGAYIINKKGAKQIMKMFINNYWNLPKNKSHNADSLIYNLCNTYTSRNPFFIYPTENTSEIHQNHISFHNKSKKQIIQCIYNSAY